MLKLLVDEHISPGVTLRLPPPRTVTEWRIRWRN
jgi:hypothetical protein